ncbi:hypothetical protein BDP27DRAFT_859829 [Rhodocollybia butyracea]|uniref:Uncharacterized protein n=1 Tax=Rhodocollybia butyracea TaxID=206335 RepID=A0A9P5P425_9AGAR|nr:hypothetical protein BDP27DRAFT_859829 [Rhodocollybia butyracea]
MQERKGLQEGEPYDVFVDVRSYCVHCMPRCRSRSHLFITILIPNYAYLRVYGVRLADTSSRIPYTISLPPSLLSTLPMHPLRHMPPAGQKLTPRYLQEFLSVYPAHVRLVPDREICEWRLRVHSPLPT